jgi:hypothetical protein
MDDKEPDTVNFRQAIANIKRYQCIEPDEFADPDIHVKRKVMPAHVLQVLQVPPDDAE